MSLVTRARLFVLLVFSLVVVACVSADIVLTQSMMPGSAVQLSKAVNHCRPPPPVPSTTAIDRNGVRSAPPLVISPPVAYLECSDQRPPPQRQPQPPAAAATAAQPGEHLMAISGDGDVTVWNLSSMTLVVKASLNPLFRSVSSGGPPLRSSTAGAGAAPASSGSPGSPGASSPRADGASSSGASAASAKKGVSVARAGVTPEGMPLVMLACQGAFGGSLQAFTFHVGLGTWVRVADGRFALSDFYSSGPCTSSSARGRVLSALQAGVRAGSSPSPSALLQASKAGTRPVAGAVSAAGGEGAAAMGRGAVSAAAMAGGAARESLQSAVTRGHLEDSLSTAVLLGSADEFLDVLRAYAGHLAKSAGFGHGRCLFGCFLIGSCCGVCWMPGLASGPLGSCQCVSWTHRLHLVWQKLSVLRMFCVNLACICAPSSMFSCFHVFMFFVQPSYSSTLQRVFLARAVRDCRA